MNAHRIIFADTLATEPAGRQISTAPWAVAPMWPVILVDTGATVLVTAHALRLLRTKS